MIPVDVHTKLKALRLLNESQENYMYFTTHRPFKVGTREFGVAYIKCFYKSQFPITAAHRVSIAIARALIKDHSVKSYDAGGTIRYRRVAVGEGDKA